VQVCLLQGFEPVMLLLAKDVTWYDERFRGPFGPRTAQALDMAQHLTFEVNPMDFVVHMPFPEPEPASMAADAIYDTVRLQIQPFRPACWTDRSAMTSVARDFVMHVPFPEPGAASVGAMPFITRLSGNWNKQLNRLQHPTCKVIHMEFCGARARFPSCRLRAWLQTPSVTR